MTRIEHLLLIAAEECDETSQRIIKALRFGLHEIQTGQEDDNIQRILYEYSQLQASMEMLKEEGVLPVLSFENVKINKKKNVEKYLLYSKEQVTLTD